MRASTMGMPRRELRVVSMRWTHENCHETASRVVLKLLEHGFSSDDISGVGEILLEECGGLVTCVQLLDVREGKEEGESERTILLVNGDASAKSDPPYSATR